MKIHSTAVRSKILSKLIFASYSDGAYYGLCVLIKDIGRFFFVSFATRQCSVSVKIQKHERTQRPDTSVKRCCQ